MKKLKLTTNPIFICPNCGKTVQLMFDPKAKGDDWLDFKCKKCGYSPGQMFVDKRD